MKISIPVVLSGILLLFSAGAGSSAQAPPAPSPDTRHCNVYNLRFAEAEEVVRRAKAEDSALWQGGKLIVDRDRNSVIFCLPQDRVEAAIAQIQRLDQPPADVAIECAVVESEAAGARDLMNQLLGTTAPPGFEENRGGKYGLGKLTDCDGDGIPDIRLCPSRRHAEWGGGLYTGREDLPSRCAAPAGTDIRGLTHVLEAGHGARVAWWAPLRLDFLNSSHPELSPPFCPATVFQLTPKASLIEPGLWCLELHLQLVTTGREPTYGSYRGHGHLVPGEVLLCGPLPLAKEISGGLPLSKAEARGKEHPRRFLLVWLRKIAGAGRPPFFAERFSSGHRVGGAPWPDHEPNRDDLFEFHSPFRRRFTGIGEPLPR